MPIFKRSSKETNNPNTKPSSSSSSSSSLSSSSPPKRPKSLFEIWAKKPKRITATCKPQWNWSNIQTIDWLTTVLIHYCNQVSSKALENARNFMSKDPIQGVTREEEDEGRENEEEEEEEELDGKYLFSATPEEWAAKLGTADGKKVFCLIFHWRNEVGGLPKGVSFPHFEEVDSYS